MLAQKVVATIEQTDVFQYLAHKMETQGVRDRYASHNYLDRMPPEDSHPLDNVFGEEDSLIGSGTEPPAHVLRDLYRR
jgi:hypothetical protein